MVTKDASVMALEQRYKTDEVARKDTKMAGNCDSDGEKCKYNSKIPSWIRLLPQYVKRRGGGEGGVKIRPAQQFFKCGGRLIQVRGKVGRGEGVVPEFLSVMASSSLYAAVSFDACDENLNRLEQLNISFGNSLSRKKYP